MKKKLTNADVYARTIKTLVSKKNVILVVPPSYVELLQQAIKCKRHEISEILLDHLTYSSSELKALGIKLERLDELSKHIDDARKESKQITEIDHLITKISVWPKEDDA